MKYCQAEANYMEVLHLLYKMKWRKHWNKEKLRLLVSCTGRNEIAKLLRRYVAAKSKEKLSYRVQFLSFTSQLFECHFHCAVALQNLLNYQMAIRQFERAMEVVSWKKVKCMNSMKCHSVFCLRYFLVNSSKR